MEESKLSVFDFDSYLDFLKVVAIPKSKYTHKKITLEKWADQLGYKSPSSLSMVLRGQRLPSQDMISSISKSLELTLYEAQYFELLVKLEKFKKSNRDISDIILKLQKLSYAHGQRPAKISHQSFTYVSEWYHIVVRGLIGSSDFQENPHWISKKLKGRISPQQAQMAINTLLDLKLISRGPTGTLAVTTESISVHPDIASIGIKTFHNDMIERAQESLKESPGDKREVFHGLTLKISNDKIEQAKKYLYQAVSHFNEEFGSGNSDSTDIFQLNIQFFCHTDSELKSTH